MPNSPKEWKALDEFGGETYRPYSVPLYLERTSEIVPAHVYVWNDDLENDGAWHYEEFKKIGSKIGWDCSRNFTVLEVGNAVTFENKWLTPCPDPIPWNLSLKMLHYNVC